MKLNCNLGPLLWNTVLLVFGWAVARFGFFGIKEEVPSNTALNYAGVILSAISGIFYLFIKTESNRSDERQPILQTDSINDINEISSVANESTEVEGNFLQNINPNVKRIVGIACACGSGVLFAFTFTPALYVQDNYPNASKNALDYVFSLYTGKNMF